MGTIVFFGYRLVQRALSFWVTSEYIMICQAFLFFPYAEDTP
jgi:hypothetical protein